MRVQVPEPTSRPCGIVHVSVQQPARDVYLPLERAEVHADIVDGTLPLFISFIHLLTLDTPVPVSAIVTVTQVFWQYSPNGLPRAKYVFPVPARAAVCGFEMIAEDGTMITAVAKEKEEARREHQAALQQGYMTGLVEHVTDDSKCLRCLVPKNLSLMCTQYSPYRLELSQDSR
jgi:hypothetical protein